MSLRLIGKCAKCRCVISVTVKDEDNSKMRHSSSCPNPTRLCTGFVSYFWVIPRKRDKKLKKRKKS
jgi:hypothetical protein